MTKPRLTTFLMECRIVGLTATRGSAATPHKGPLYIYAATPKHAYELGRISSEFELEPKAYPNASDPAPWRFDFHENQFSDKSISDDIRYKDI